jgi:hypothetical protein
MSKTKIKNIIQHQFFNYSSMSATAKGQWQGPLVNANSKWATNVLIAARTHYELFNIF